VVCFTATQIPDIQGRRYPSELTGRLYPEGIPIHSDNRLFDLVKDNHVDLTRLIIIHKPSIRYGYKDHSTSTLAELIRERIPA